MSISELLGKKDKKEEKKDEETIKANNEDVYKKDIEKTQNILYNNLMPSDRVL